LFDSSDVYRDELKVMGVIVLDQKSGPSGWKFANGQSKKLPSGISIPEDSAKKRKREPDAAEGGKKNKPVVSAKAAKAKSKDQSRNLAVLQAVMGATEEHNQNVVKGVRIEDLGGGHGRAAAAGDKIKVHYMGRLQGANGKEGKIFDCSSKKPFAFKYVLLGYDVMCCVVLC
jgi:FKBP-type peptidyl-prolyl cis-trans isomerase